jgi:hypothetical protein
MTTERQDLQPSIPFLLGSRRVLAFVPWCAFTALVLMSALDGSLRFLLGIFALTSAVGAPVMELLYRTHRATGEILAALASVLFYIALTLLILRTRRRSLAYLFFFGLLGSLLFSTGAFVILRFGKQ